MGEEIKSKIDVEIQEAIFIGIKSVSAVILSFAGDSRTNYVENIPCIRMK